jgi:hypothetical protein
VGTVDAWRFAVSGSGSLGRCPLSRVGSTSSAAALLSDEPVRVPLYIYLYCFILEMFLHFPANHCACAAEVFIHRLFAVNQFRLFHVCLCCLRTGTRTCIRTGTGTHIGVPIRFTCTQLNMDVCYVLFQLRHHAILLASNATSSPIIQRSCSAGRRRYRSPTTF